MRNNILIYNTLTKRKEKLVSIIKNHIGMYVCGPTVYGDPHLGHARPAITFDIVFRYLKHCGYKVRYVRNITDAGHLENDSDEGEDKISKKARIEEFEPMEIVQLYTISYHQAMQELNCLPPSIEPRATGHIIEQIQMIKKIISNEYAYEVNGSIYLDVHKYNKKFKYGVLSGRTLTNNLEGTRELDKQSEKRNPEDFAIWKNAESSHIMKWPSPWGDGFPGWHMECSAMSEKYLGDKFDIHGGGIDLVFPHHEAEIAQSNACNNKIPANYWMHNNMITIDGKKMGKSLNNFITLNEFFNGNHKKLDQAYLPMTIRFFILQAQYRSTLDFSNTALKSAEKGFMKLMSAMETLKKIKSSKTSSHYKIKELEESCYKAMNDDFNTPILIAHLFEAVKVINSLHNKNEKISKNELDTLNSIFNVFVTEILGLVSSKNKSNDLITDDLMQIIIKIRNESKKNKDWKTSDFIRSELERIGVQMNDTKDGVKWEILYKE